LTTVLLVPACGEPPQSESWSETSWEETIVGCGDGVLDAGEQCDEGEANSNTEADACRTTCVSAHCGDGVIDSAETCDDGETLGGDGCSAWCATEAGQLEVEPNDEPDEAEAWSGETVNGRLSTDDRDCFSFPVDTCQAVEARLAEPCPDHVRIGLFDPDGAELATSSTDDAGCAWLDPADSEGARFVATEGTWAVCLSSVTGAPVPGYALELSVLDPEPGQFVWDDSEDADGDGFPDTCDPDIDDDGVLNEDDNCPYTPNGADDQTFSTSSSGFINTWLSAGPYTGVRSESDCTVTDEDWTGVADAEIDPALSDAAGDLVWRALHRSGNRINFNDDYEDVGAPREIYVVAHVRSAEARDLTLALGPDDGARAWFDGAEVMDITDCQGTVKDKYQETVSLSGDWQPLVIKVYDQGGGWALYARFLDADGAEVTDLEVALTPDGAGLSAQQDTDGDGIGDVCDLDPLVADDEEGDTG